jgi:F-type H+-transporting ATPase subunit epsilon
VKRGDEEESFAIGGGFLEVLPDRVTVLADAAERAEEIDLARAESARQRAEDRLQDMAQTDVDYTRADAALRRSLVRIKVAEARRRRRGRRVDVQQPGGRSSSE